MPGRMYFILPMESHRKWFFLRDKGKKKEICRPRILNTYLFSESLKPVSHILTEITKEWIHFGKKVKSNKCFIFPGSAAVILEEAFLYLQKQ